MKIRNVGDYSHYVGYENRHPLVCVIDYAEVSPVRHCLNNYSIYGIFFHDEAEIDLSYGCGKYDYKERYGYLCGSRTDRWQGRQWRGGDADGLGTTFPS